MSRQLSSDEVDALYQKKQIEDDGGEAVVVEQRAVDAVREILGEALRERGVSNPDSLSLEALAGQFTDLEREQLEDTVTALSRQHPETGGARPEELSESPGELRVESLSAPSARDAYEKCKLIDTLESRDIHKRAQELREELAGDLDVDEAALGETEDLKNELKDAIR